MKNFARAMALLAATCSLLASPAHSQAPGADFPKGVGTGKIAWLVDDPYIPLGGLSCDSDSDVEQW